MLDTERKRLEALKSYRILDTAPEPAFDEIAKLADHIFQASDRPHGVVQDVADSRQALETLRKSQVRYKLLAENMADVVTTIRLDGSSDYVSPAVHDLLGYHPHELAGRPVHDFVSPEDRSQFAAAIAELAAGREEATLQHRAHHRDGHVVWVETRFRLVRDEAGRPHEMIAVIRDLSERRGLEAQLAATEARASSIIADANMAVVSLDEAGCILGWNRSAETIFGWRADEVLGQVVHDILIPRRDRDRYAAGLELFKKANEATVLNQRFEFTALRKNGGRSAQRDMRSCRSSP
ncbi:PAS domain S-box protein [Phenylobacterium sp. LjRoot225]|uniref:PAS domain-containing protein n=1 Tax=Phenylobacterium sp. LjRoot225 TaxID=3342285 RepID=UPI003ECF951E